MIRRFAIAVAVIAACIVACRGARLTRFDHRAHLAETACGGPNQHPCLNCTSCHQGLATNPDRFAPPSVATCAGCHDDAQTKLLHVKRPNIATQPDGKRILFSHDKHLGMEELKGQCVKCHGGAVGFQSGPPLFPPMETCLSCHQHRQQFAKGECLGCHQKSDLQALKPVSFLSHDAAWMRRHGDSARNNQTQCASCHAQSSCDNCHDSTRRLGPAQANPEQIDRTFVHRFDFVGRHALEAQSQPGSCVTCHAQTECNACHATRGVSPSVRGAQSPHPPGWASGMVSNTHGPAARRDVASCAACHDQGPASNCVTCHKVGAYGGNPHPPRWRSSEPFSAPQCEPCHRGAL